MFFEILDNFFTNLSLLTPNLKEFEFHYFKHIYSNKDLIDLSLIKHLKRLVLYSSKEDHSTDDSAVIQLSDNCKAMNELILNFRSNITVKTIDKLKEVANNRPKERITFGTMSSDNELISYGQSMAEITPNLFIYIWQITSFISYR